MSTLLVIAKEPRPGRVKTRLQQRFSPEQAAGLAAASLADTLAAVLAAPAARRVVALEGTAGDWLPAGVDVIGQGAGGLDLRLDHAFAQVFAAGPGPVLLVGMDTPQLTPAVLGEDWNGADAALGLSEDGGFWAVGLRRPVPGVFAGVPMSTAYTGAVQLARLHARGLRVHLLPVLRDVDTPDDAAAVAGQAPHTRFGRLYQHLTDPIPAPRPVPPHPVLAPVPPHPPHPVHPVHPVHPLDLYAAALDGRAIRVELADGRILPLGAERWSAAPDGIDWMMLSRCEGTVLDVGCGPGRLVGALAEAGVPALGVDVSARAVQLTAERGACVLRRAVQGPLPGEGRWGTVLLADGNLGIGGDPAALLRRCRGLLHAGGLLLVEADPDDELDDVTPVILIDATGRRADPLPWARLGRLAVARTAERTGFVVVEEWRAAARVFLALRATSVPLGPGDRREPAGHGAPAPG